MGMEKLLQKPGWATVRIETEKQVYVGKIYVPETKRRLSDVLSDERQFISLTDVTVGDSKQVEPYVALNKDHVVTIRILKEGQGGQ
jgi:hypothetical protein